MKNWHLVLYDIRDPKRLRRVAKHLAGYGSRVQYSVFRCRLTARDLERLRWELTRILEDEDDLLIVRLCSRCAATIRTGDTKEDWHSADTTYIIV